MQSHKYKVRLSSNQVEVCSCKLKGRLRLVVFLSFNCFIKLCCSPEQTTCVRYMKVTSYLYLTFGLYFCINYQANMENTGYI